MKMYLAAFSLAQLLYFAPASAGQCGQDWTWVDKIGVKRCGNEMLPVLAEHKKFKSDLEASQSPGKWGGLSGAKLVDAPLDGVDLQYAVLQHADLRKAHLKTADLRDTDLTDADLTGADLTGAKLNGANLTRADFHNATMIDTNLRFAEMGGALLTGADLERVNFEPTSSPQIRGLAAAKHLALLTYDRNPDALAQVRKQLQEGGFRSRERQIIYAMNRRETETAGWFGWLRYFFFDITCQYGLSPNRLLLIWASFWLLFTLFYIEPIQRAQVDKSGIFILESKSLTDSKDVGIKPIGINNSQGVLWFDGVGSNSGSMSAIRWAAFFSLVNGFSLGFRELNLGQWFLLLTKGEVSMKARGLIRFVAGVQALLSLYLLALWLLTYFGRPFAE